MQVEVVMGVEAGVCVANEEDETVSHERNAKTSVRQASSRCGRPTASSPHKS
jgi:hypothetical protein